MRSKTFRIRDPQDLHKIDTWWAKLLRTSPKEMGDLEWAADGDLSWTVKIYWQEAPYTDTKFTVCMPAYSEFTVEDLKSMRKELSYHLTVIEKSIGLFADKLKQLGVSRASEPNAAAYLEVDADILLEFSVNPFLRFERDLDAVDLITVSSYIWPTYENLLSSQKELLTRIGELSREIRNRQDSDYITVTVDRGILRGTFADQLGYDSPWLFAPDEELIGDDE